MQPILVTGTAGFIGSHVALRLLADGHQVVGLDNLNDYYDVRLKQARLARVAEHPGYTHITADLADRGAIEVAFARHRPSRVIHLAAQAGVRYAAENPHVYVSSNVTGTLHILEGCRAHAIEHLVFASTSSVYGANTRMPFAEDQPTEHPLTLYAATKKANEMMAHSYAHLYNIPCTGLRFFTVYGPWGRPDMALFLFTKAILAGEPIKVFNHGKHKRSFTYVDDIVEGIVRILEKPPAPLVGDVTPTYDTAPASRIESASCAEWASRTKSASPTEPVGRPYVADGQNPNPAPEQRFTDNGLRFTENQGSPPPQPVNRKPQPVNPSSSPVAPYRIYNIGNETTVELLRYIEVLEDCLGKKAKMAMLPLQPGDVPDTESDVSQLAEAINYRPVVQVEEGVRNFVEWYRGYYE
ncbi:MAG: NAD-dependent epimerase [Wenzhouxiangella sp.]